jgi:membrane protease YdiL (CAAX protease family)
LATVLFIILLDTGYYFSGVIPLPVKEILPTLIFQLVIVVCSEEIIFRGVIFRFLYQFHWLLAILLSALLFSLFHFAVYQGSINALLTAFLMGVVFAWCTKRWNIGVALGLHFAWNIFCIGITALI